MHCLKGRVPTLGDVRPTMDRFPFQVASIKNEDVKIRQDSMTKLLTDVQMMKGKQESMDSKLIAMKQ